MFDKLQSLPLFVGLGVSELMRLVEIVNLDFQKYTDGKMLAMQGGRCDKAIYVLDGGLNAEFVDPTLGLMVTEWGDVAPLLLEVENLWGTRQQYSRTYTFLTEGSTCSIEKRQLMRLIGEFDVIRTNLLGMLSNEVQRARLSLHAPVAPTVEGRILQFIKSRSVLATGGKEIRVKMTPLAHLVNATRLNVSAVLNAWQDLGLVELRRGIITINEYAKLNEYYEAKQRQ